MSNTQKSEPQKEQQKQSIFKTGVLHWLLLAAVGLLLVIGHNLAQEIICKIIAVGLILLACTGAYKWWKEKSTAPEALAGLVGYIAALLLGIWILFNTKQFISIINVVIGAVIAVTGAINLYRAWKLHAKIDLVLNLLAIALGVVVAVYNAATSLPVILQGIALIYTAVVGCFGDWKKSRVKAEGTVE